MTALPRPSLMDAPAAFPVRGGPDSTHPARIGQWKQVRGNPLESGGGVTDDVARVVTGVETPLFSECRDSHLSCFKTGCGTSLAQEVLDDDKPETGKCLVVTGGGRVGSSDGDIVGADPLPHQGQDGSEIRLVKVAGRNGDVGTVRPLGFGQRSIDEASEEALEGRGISEMFRAHASILGAKQLCGLFDCGWFVSECFNPLHVGFATKPGELALGVVAVALLRCDDCLFHGHRAVNDCERLFVAKRLKSADAAVTCQQVAGFFDESSLEHLCGALIEPVVECGTRGVEADAQETEAGEGFAGDEVLTTACGQSDRPRLRGLT